MSTAKSSKTASIGLLTAITTSLCCITPSFLCLRELEELPLPFHGWSHCGPT